MIEPTSISNAIARAILLLEDTADKLWKGHIPDALMYARAAERKAAYIVAALEEKEDQS